MNAVTQTLDIPPHTPDAAVRQSDTDPHPARAHGAGEGTRPTEATYGYAPSPGTTRYDGWTPAKQRTFLEAVSEGHSITHACRVVGLTPQSAYALRRRAAGAPFAVGWQAAALLGREVLADELMDRALHGVTDTFTYRNGETAERHRHDNRLAMSMLTRLDKQADAARGAACDAAARLVAAEFEPFLDMIGRDASPARAGLFLGARAEAALPDDLEPVRALARADKWLRTHTDLAADLDTSDLDPARRAGWTAEQWARAEAAGLLVLAPAPRPEPDPDSRDGNRQLHQPDAEPDEDRGPVWWSEYADGWRTSFPPPGDFHGEEEGEFGESGYARTLTPEEAAVADAPWRAEVEARTATETLERDAWFGFTPAPPRPAARLPLPGDDEEDWDDEEWDDEEEDADDDGNEDPEAATGAPDSAET